MDILSLPHGNIPLPAFFPDATRGAVRCTDISDLCGCRVEGLVMNTYHLMMKPGRTVVKSLGGLHQFTGWDRPILTDSGGFQVFSLIRENNKFGEITPSRIIFRPENGEKIILTPEKCIQSQFAYKSDIMMCLDYCTHPDDPYEINKKSVEITINWAERCKNEYMKLLAENKKTTSRFDKPFEITDSAVSRPLLFGIIQGGGDKALRKECAEALTEIGFDGFGFGGWPLDSNGKLVIDILEYTASLMPDFSIKYAMGLGKPENIVICNIIGYNLFDCVIPTREARNNRLYVYSDMFETPGDMDRRSLSGNFYEFFYPLDEKYIRDNKPVSKICDCLLCKNYSRAFLRHLLVTGDSTGSRLATIHNLRFYTMLTEALRSDG